ncbi:UNVERIFIED_CONTAM: hypothetical protein K2H54_039540 [Gekko kuhli]
MDRGRAAAAAAAAGGALQQCGQLQDLIDISLSSLRGLRTKCAASNDLTQQEIRTLERPTGVYAVGWLTLQTLLPAERGSFCWCGVGEQLDPGTRGVDGKEGRMWFQ